MNGTTLQRPDEQQLVVSLQELLADRLPQDWNASVEVATQGRDGPDALLSIASPDGQVARLYVETKPSLYPRDAYTLRAQFQRLWPHLAPLDRPNARAADSPLLVLTRFLTPRTREILTSLGVSYADATGNLRIVSTRPPVYVELAGADTNPWVESRPLQSLKGSGSARVVRAVLDFRPPYTLRDLAEAARLPLGTTSRVLGYLVEEALVTRIGRGPIEAADWLAIIRRWSEDYRFLQSNRAQFFLEPRGPKALLTRMRSYGGTYAITGSVAAAQRAQVATPELVSIYVDNIERASTQLELRPATSGANVVLLKPASPVALERTWVADDLTFVALSQVAADLLTAPGRGPTEAEALLEWMQENEDDWRQSRLPAR